MEYLSWLFFCLSPFALFCSENGTGLILCPVFIILGFIFKWAGSNAGSSSQVVVKVDQKKFWEWHYKDCMRNTLEQKDSIGDYLMSVKDKEARSWATTICGYHNAWVPPEGIQEQIARANGVVTEKMIKEREEKKDRIQVGKYFLMSELAEKYRSMRVGKGGKERCYFPRSKITKDIYKIKTSDGMLISDYWLSEKYNKSAREVWESLSEKEKNQVKQWVEEYEKQLIEEVYEYVEGKCYDVIVKMDF